MTGDKAIAGDLLLLHPEVGTAVGDQAVHLFKRSLVQQEFDAFPSRQLALAMLTLASSRASALFGQSVAAFQFLKFRLYGHDWIIERLARQNMQERERAEEIGKVDADRIRKIDSGDRCLWEAGAPTEKTRLHHMATKQAVIFSGRTNPTGNSATQQDENAGTTHDYRQCGFDKLPSFAKRCQTCKSHSVTPRTEVDTFVSIDSIIRTWVDFGLKKMNLKLIFCKTLRSLGETEEVVARWQV